MTAAIQTSGLTKAFGRTRAVAGLDLRVGTGEVFGFLGPNGAGKTTTIRMLLALHRPTSGRAAVLGLDPATDSVAIHRRTGYLPGELALYPRMTGQAHIDWFARARGLRDLSLARDLAGRFGAVLDRPARELSTGNRQKIGLILAFMASPELLVLDEPTTGLDPLMQAEFELLVREVGWCATSPTPVPAHARRRVHRGLQRPERQQRRRPGHGHRADRPTGRESCPVGDRAASASRLGTPHHQPARAQGRDVLGVPPPLASPASMRCRQRRGTRSRLSLSACWRR
jgi:ABC-type Na+ transport system ATPase subunit NatA